MIKKYQILPFFDILKNGKYINQNNLYNPGVQTNKKLYGFQNRIQHKKD